MLRRHLGKMDCHCLVALLVESQLGIPKLEPDIIFSNRVPLVSVELEYVDVGNDQHRVSQCGRDVKCLQMTTHLFNCTNINTQLQVTDLWMAPVEVGHLLVEWRGPPVN